MTTQHHDPDPLAALLRAATPAPLADDGFVAGTLARVDAAARALPARRRAAPVAPLAIARALAAQQRLHDGQARLWRWAMAGIAAGFLLLLLAVLMSPGGDALNVAAPPQWFPLCCLLAVGAVWVAWREVRSA